MTVATVQHHDPAHATSMDHNATISDRLERTRHEGHGDAGHHDEPNGDGCHHGDEGNEHR